MPAQSIKIPLKFFTQGEALIVTAAGLRIFPTDDTGPGACEAGVVIYIDPQLAGPFGRDRHRSAQGPFDENVMPEFGYQGAATRARLSSFLGEFAQCPDRPGCSLT